MRCLVKAFLSFVGVLLFGLVKVISQWKKIQFVQIRSGRLGHLSIELSLFFRRKKLGLFPDDRIYILVLPGRAANSYFIKGYKRQAHMVYGAVGKVLEIMLGNKKNIWMKLQYNATESEEYDEVASSFTILPCDIINSKRSCQDFGLDIDKRKFVCVHARDSEYLKTVFPTKDWRYHHYRDADIDTYIKGINYLIEKGYFVIRVGRVVEKAVSFSHKMFFDYAASSYKSDLMDLFLLRYCEFLVGTASGVADCAYVTMDKPVLAVNFSPFSYGYWKNKSLYLDKKIVDRETREVVPFYRVCEMIEVNQLINGSYVYKQGLEYCSNTEDEILEGIKDMCALISGELVLSREDIKLNSLYQKHYAGNKSYPYLVRGVRVTPAALRGNKALYFPEKSLESEFTQEYNLTGGEA